MSKDIQKLKYYLSLRWRQISIIFFSSIWIGSIPCCAKSYPFKINRERNVVISQSSAPGTKIVKVVSLAGNAKKAINLALQDAVYASLFIGISGNGEFESVPAILFDGQKAYQDNKKVFNRFFKKGEFMSYAHLVNSEFPSGKNNVSSPQGRKVTVYVVVEYSKLLNLFDGMGIKTYTSIFKTSK